MSISKKQVAEIKAVIQSFIDNNAFAEGEDHILASYILEILKIIGWDNSKWRLKPHKDTIGKFPDILLRNKSGGFVFIIEAKESNKSLDDSYGKLTFARQLCNYCNAHGLYWGILTNFLEWRIYNTVQYENDNDYYEKKILLIDKEKKQMVCTDEQLQYLFGLIEYENLNAIKGRISKDKSYYRKQDEIREDFFAQLKNWRAKLRNYLHQKYPEEEASIIDNQTQKILDRFIFIAYCYKKEIISQDYLSAVLFSERIDFYEELKKNFINLNEKFNSDIFAADKCDEWKIDDEVLEDIIPQINSIDFSQLNPNIIGEIYENYLGELLRATKKNIQVVDSKESVKRKKQGIYYTPEYIVKYIVDNTIGELLKKCKTEKDIEKIKVIDIACGSGSFLLYAFDVFKNAYENARRKQHPDIFTEISLRKKILLNNLYGVDLDERAVDIAKLNLLLKALEGLQETEKNGRKILPNLSLNIRCGNSLIYGSYKDEEIETNGQLNFLFDKKSDFKNDIRQLVELKEKFYKEEDNEEKERIIKQAELHEAKINKYLNKDLKNYFDNTDKIQPFNFDVAFCEVIKNGGFNSVIGNPPYGAFFSQKEKHYLVSKYSYIKGQPESYEYFMARVFRNLESKGKFGFIVPSNFIESDRGEGLREKLLSSGNIDIISNFRYKVWKDKNASEPLVIIYSQNKNATLTKVIHPNSEQEFKTEKDFKKFRQADWKLRPKKRFLLRANYKIIKKIESKSTPLKDICEVSQGIIPYRTSKEGKKNLYISKKDKGKEWVKLLDGDSTIKRYRIEWGGNWLKYGEWLWCPREIKFFTEPKILYGAIRNKSLKRRLIGCYDKSRFYNRHNFNNIISKDKNYNLKFVLALFNSILINYWYRGIYDNVNINPTNVNIIPIREINFKNSADKKIHDKLVALVDEMLELNKYPKDNENKIKVVDLEIDELVYTLYDINDKEKRIIDESLKN